MQNLAELSWEDERLLIICETHMSYHVEINCVQVIYLKVYFHELILVPVVYLFFCVAIVNPGTFAKLEPRKIHCNVDNASLSAFIVFFTNTSEQVSLLLFNKWLQFLSKCLLRHNQSIVKPFLIASSNILLPLFHL